MKNVFEIICKKCGGKCCKTTILLTQNDADKIKAQGLKFKVKNEETGSERPPGLMALVDGKCPFLSLKSGCTLKKELKPFDCIFFPLAFTYKNSQITMYLNKKCPYFNEIPKEWIDETKKWALTQLKKWSEEEKKEYSKMIEKYPSSQLIPV